MVKVDSMLPSQSPNTLSGHGVRRLNNRPLYIVISVVVIFTVIIIMVAIKRGQQQQVTLEKPIVSHSVTSLKMAEDIFAGHEVGIIPAKSVVEEPQLSLPVAVLDNPDAPPRPYRLSPPDAPDNPELIRIRLEQLHDFEAAVKAKTHVSITEQPVAHAKPMAHSWKKEEGASAMESDSSAQFKQRLHDMQGHQHSGLAPTDKGLTAKDKANRWSLTTNVEAPDTPYVLRTGSIIPGVMINGINPELPDQVIGQVSETVYDTATGRYPLIPQGAKLFGAYSNQIMYGQSAVLIVWQRIIFPDGKALDIGAMPGSDSAGYGGFRDKVDNHYGRIFGSALLMSAITGGITYSQTSNQQPLSQPTAGSVMSEALGQQLGQVTAKLILKNIDIAPSLTIRPGYRFHIKVVKDLSFNSPYRAFDY